ncbi:MAG: molybdopterin molybdenumtransferase MoeA [Deltaproteobacteria bacterium]|nr:MAG: molybdopterin molybdenumtransferase MoeA [Deltaproteobacteria bacterium]
MISVEEARKTILEAIEPLPAERLCLLDVLGRVLAEDVVSTRTIPPWDNSAMDGYALRAEDTEGAAAQSPVSLQIVGEVAAGGYYEAPLQPGEAVRILTGAPVPAGANAVVMQEIVEVSDGTLRLRAPVPRGANVRPAGEDVAAGTCVLQRGTPLKPAHIGMLAALGKSFVQVFQRPRVAILATGDELVEVDRPLGQGQITNSNAYALTAQVEACGAQPVMLGIARDHPDDLREKLRAAIHADLLVTSGGVSVGDFDYVKEVLAAIGCTMRFWKVAMKPGKPLAFGTMGGKPVFGLPGNPVSTMVSFELFVRPALRRMMGDRAPFAPELHARLDPPLRGGGKRTNFVRVTLHHEGGELVARSTGNQGSGILSSMVAAHALAVLPPDDAQHSEADLILLDPHALSPPFPNESSTAD